MRYPTPRRKPQKVQTANFVAPVGGWIANRALAQGRAANMPSGAAVLDNFFPTATGVLLRRGSQKRYSIGAGPVQSLFKYTSGGQVQLFASINGPIHDVSLSSSSEVYAGGSDGNWQVQQITTSGGTFLIGVNGIDPAFVYDGVSFSEATAITFPSGNNLDTHDLSFVWLHSNRLWFIQKNSMSAWYLPVDQIGGELTEVPLGGVFTLGGVIVWGQTWSLTSGGSGGLSDQCVFMSSEGEVLAYQGANPADINSWSKVGTYRIGEPLGPKAFFRSGGDILIATTVGLVSLSEAAQKDYAAIGSTAASYPIEEAWTEALTARGMIDWRCLLWPEGKMVIVAPPSNMNAEPVSLIANSNTGAWCRFTTWDIRSASIFNGSLHFGDSRGNMWIGNVTGADDEKPYTGLCVPLFDDLGAAAARKVARSACATKRSRYKANESLTAVFDFIPNPGNAPNAANIGDASVWGSSIWGQSAWGESAGEIVTSNWKSLGGSGRDVSVAFQVSSGDLVPIDVELIRLVANFEICGMIS